MINSFLSQIQSLATLGFCLGFIAIVILVLLAWRYHTPWALRYAKGLALPVLFSLMLGLSIAVVRFATFWLAALLIWGTLLVAAVLVLVGFQYKSARSLVVSAILSIPFSLYLFFSSGIYAAVIVPVVLLGCAGLMHWFQMRAQKKNARAITRANH